MAGDATATIGVISGIAGTLIVGFGVLRVLLTLYATTEHVDDFDGRAGAMAAEVLRDAAAAAPSLEDRAVIQAALRTTR